MKRAKTRKRDGEGRLRPTIDSLRVLVELGDRMKAVQGQGGSFASLSEVANALSSSYSKSNVFRALAELRKVYRRQLVNRSTVTLTSEGEAVYEWARSLLALHAKGTHWPIAERESVRIGASSWILQFLLPGVAEAFLSERARRKAQAPDVDLVFSEFDVEEILSALRKGTVHAGFAAVFSVEAYPGLTLETLRERVPTVMVSARHHKRWGRERRKETDEVSLAELSGETICVIEQDLYRVLSGLPAPAKGANRLLVQNYSAVVAFVQAGAGVGFVPEMRGSGLESLGLEVYRVKQRLLSRTLAILRRAGEELSEEVQGFLRIASEALK